MAYCGILNPNATQRHSCCSVCEEQRGKRQSLPLPCSASLRPTEEQKSNPDPWWCPGCRKSCRIISPVASLCHVMPRICSTLQSASVRVQKKTYKEKKQIICSENQQPQSISIGCMPHTPHHTSYPLIPRNSWLEAHCREQSPCLGQARALQRYQAGLSFFANWRFVGNLSGSGTEGIVGTDLTLTMSPVKSISAGCVSIASLRRMTPWRSTMVLGTLVYVFF